MLGSKKILILLIITSTLGLCLYLALGKSGKKLDSPNSKLNKLPRIMLWAWERTENLKFINPSTTGVAFLAKTVLLKGEDVTIRPRLQPLELATGTIQIAVVRIETDRYQTPKLSTLQMDKTLAAITSLTKLNNIVGLQIDFDAKVSERGFYRELLEKLRKALPTNYLLSITALASWTIYDNWIKDLPIDDAIPMLFRMGAEKQEVLNYLATKKDFNSEISRQSVGIATDETLPYLPKERRLYIFAAQSWTAELLSSVLEKVEKCQTK